jgi:beta-glucosidase
MPGPSRFRGEALLHAINANKVKESILDQRVLTILKTVKYASQEIQPEAPNIAVDGASESDILRRAACESIVLLKNEGSILPLDKTKTVAVIGPNSKITTYSGGGSANLVPSYVISPYEGVQAKSSFEVPWSLGVYAHKDLPLLGHLLKRADQETGFSFKAYDKARGSKTRTILDTLHLVDSNMFLIDYVCPNTTSLLYFIDIEGTFTPEEDGIYDFGLTVHGTGRLFINGELIVDNTSNQLPGVSFFGAGTREEVGSIKLCAGRSYELLVEFATSPTSKLPKQEITSFGPGGIRIGGCKRVNPTDSIQQAVQLASQTDQVIVFAGLNSDWEAESSDRPDISLPPYTDKLISEVLIANPKAVIVLQSGTPVAMPWVGDASAIVHAWYGGNETGNAIADVLFGDFNPVCSRSVDLYNTHKYTVRQTPLDIPHPQPRQSSLSQHISSTWQSPIWRRCLCRIPTL